MMASQQTPQAPQKGGGMKRIIGILGDAMLGAAGQQGIYGPMMAQKSAQEDAYNRQQQLAKQAREWGMQDFYAREDYQRANPTPTAPDAFEKALMGAGIRPNSPEGQALYKERAANMAGGQDEFVVVPVPGGTYAGPKSGLESAFGRGAPAGPVGKLTPITGGGVGNVTSGFRR